MAQVSNMLIVSHTRKTLPTTVKWDIFTSTIFCKTLAFALEENFARQKILLGKSLLSLYQHLYSHLGTHGYIIYL